MSILVNKNTRVITQGITGSQGIFHTEMALKYGTNVVGGVTPGKGGSKAVDGKVPVFNSVAQAVDETGANASMIYVPPLFAADAIMEAADAGIEVVICITEGIPIIDMIRVKDFLRTTPGVKLIGPNCPGVITPDECKMGIMPGYIHQRGHIGIVSRSGTLTYEAVSQLSSRNLGQSTVVGIGGDPINGLTHLDVMKRFAADDDTLAVVMIGEIGGSNEEQAAEWAAENMNKPVVGFIAGATAPEGKRMGHAGAIVSGSTGSAQSKIAAMKAAGIRMAPTIVDVGKVMEEFLLDMDLLDQCKNKS
ncbi:succinate--CoA ligase subunit alpha [Desulfurispira natronophila]|uniref:Succinate--CoA ligase [ADP-forming] subunit alpha n=1 Tax=Desulfurispira natronophila TaxID=682562 RepID=A0A7W7Y4Q7_9BACT|nr:succinate--CoA ligase subunit alpha [Desulfurispira natronophila]MBB5022045.1 succinyl-CoA synthetase alpha subunit [Desulfurispira natronophila]